MSYTPTEWKTGDVITAERLNKAEQGIKDAHDAADTSSGGGSNIFYIYALGDEDEGMTGISKTYQEISEAVFHQKKLPVFVDLDGHHYQYDRFSAGFWFMYVHFEYDAFDTINSIGVTLFRIKDDGTYETKFINRRFS